MSVIQLITWREEISSELIEAREQLVIASDAASSAALTAKALSEEYQAIALELTRLPALEQLARPLAGRLEARKASRDTARQQALTTEREQKTAAARVTMLEHALVQLDLLTEPVSVDSESVIVLHPAGGK